MYSDSYLNGRRRDSLGSADGEIAEWARVGGGKGRGAEGVIGGGEGRTACIERRSGGGKKGGVRTWPLFLMFEGRYHGREASGFKR